MVSDRFGDTSSSTDLQQQYMLLLNEREELLQYQETLHKEVQHATEKKKDSEELAYALQERMRHLEQELTQANKSLLDKKMKVSRLRLVLLHSFMFFLYIGRIGKSYLEESR